MTIVQQTNGLGIGLPTPSATKYFIVNFSWHKLCDNIALKLIATSLQKEKFHFCSYHMKFLLRESCVTGQQLCTATPTKALLLLYTQEYHTTGTQFTFRVSFYKNSQMLYYHFIQREQFILVHSIVHQRVGYSLFCSPLQCKCLVAAFIADEAAFIYHITVVSCLGLQYPTNW